MHTTYAFLNSYRLLPTRYRLQSPRHFGFEMANVHSLQDLHIYFCSLFRILMTHAPHKMAKKTFIRSRFIGREFCGFVNSQGTITGDSQKLLSLSGYQTQEFDRAF